MGQYRVILLYQVLHFLFLPTNFSNKRTAKNEVYNTYYTNYNICYNHTVNTFLFINEGQCSSPTQ